MWRHSAQATPAGADGLYVHTQELTDAELSLVAGVARREGWADPLTPPAAHGPRTLDEMRAVARFEAALRARSGPSPRPARDIRALIGGLSAAAKARLAMVAIALVVLGICWWISPARTALGLLGAGVVCLIAMRRGPRRAGGTVPGMAGPWPGVLRRR